MCMQHISAYESTYGLCALTCAYMFTYLETYWRKNEKRKKLFQTEYGIAFRQLRN